MKDNTELINYICAQRWCSFKEDTNKIQDIQLESIDFDNGNKKFILGQATFSNQPSKNFLIPMSISDNDDHHNTIEIDGQNMSDALQAPDYWEKLMELFKQNKGEFYFPNGNKIKLIDIAEDAVIRNNLHSPSKPLNVEQSNTTIKVGDNAIAFKQERMIQSDFGLCPEIEMNQKLMVENATVAPKTYGAMLMTEPNGKVASLGIIQEFVPNRGDLWSFAGKYLLKTLQDLKNEGIDKVAPSQHSDFIQMMHNLGEKTFQMSEALGSANGNPNFEPEIFDSSKIKKYQLGFKALLTKTKKIIERNIDNLQGDTKHNTEHLLQNWDKLTDSFIKQNIATIKNSTQPYYATRVHGDFHLGQVLVKKNMDLCFIDFAGEPGLSITERKRKHPKHRDVAGMYRSISGYLGAAVAQDFAKDTQEELWARQALQPLINASTKAFMGKHSAKEPFMAMEILRKNLYEVQYEVGNRPHMAFIPISGLTELLTNTSQKVPQNQR